MNEKMQYLTMLEMPISTANVTVKPSKKKRRVRKVDAESVKKELIDKINSDEVEAPVVQEQVETSEQTENLLYEDNDQETLTTEQFFSNQTAIVKSGKAKRKRKPFKVSVIAVQFAVIGALVATIFLTSAINTNSGINVFFRNVFGGDSTQVSDTREYTEFTPVLSVGEDGLTLTDGVITFSSSGSVYSSCEGKISSINFGEDGKYSVEIEHSLNFKTIVGGLDFVYGEVGGVVYSNLPVGYASAEGATMCFTNADGSVISDYQIVDNSVVWAV